MTRTAGRPYAAHGMSGPINHDQATTEAPCRICGASREAHYRVPTAHRYRAERYCEAYRSGTEWTTPCGRVASFWVRVVDTEAVDPERVYVAKLMCAGHKGAAVRKWGDAIEAEKMRPPSDYY